MAKALKNILAGVKSSKIVPGSLGKDPGVDYHPKAPEEQNFVALHKVEKHADRNGNGDDIYQATNIKHVLAKPEEKRHGYKKPADKNVNEAMMKSEAKCNMSEAGTLCEVHGMKKCVNEGMMKSEDNKKMDVPFPGPYDKPSIAKPKNVAKNAARKAMKKVMKKVMTKEEVEEYCQCVIQEDMAVPLLGGSQSGQKDDESAEMAKAELKAIANKSMNLVMQIPDTMIIEPWVQSKIAQAKVMISGVHDYMVYGDHDKPEEDEQAPMDTPMTFPGMNVDQGRI